MQTHVSIPSDGLELAAVLHVPDGAQGGLPAIVVMHGFGGNKDGETHLIEALMYENLGYVVLRFDMRGCGESGGVPGRIICQDQVADVRNVVTWLRACPYVAQGRVLLRVRVSGRQWDSLPVPLMTAWLGSLPLAGGATGCKSPAINMRHLRRGRASAN